MSLRSFAIRLLAILGIVALAIVAFIVMVRPWHVRWGATDAEVAQGMAGDEVVGGRDFAFTRAITINAKPDAIWPWILQMGHRRAGFYAYDWFDNGGVRSSEVIIPELQLVGIGDVIPISSLVKYRVWSIDPNQAIVWVSDDEPISGSWTWSLFPAGESETRLITRMSGRVERDLPAVAFHWVIDAGDVVFMRKSMLGIKQRVEGNITDTSTEVALEGVLWLSSLLQFLASLGLVLKHRRWLRPWLLALAIAAAFMFTFYARPPLALATSLQFGTLIALIWVYRTGRGSRASMSAEPN